MEHARCIRPPPQHAFCLHTCHRDVVRDAQRDVLGAVRGVALMSLSGRREAPSLALYLYECGAGATVRVGVEPWRSRRVSALSCGLCSGAAAVTTIGSRLAVQLYNS